MWHAALGANSFQLLHQYSPVAALMLGVLVPCLEPLGLEKDAGPGTLRGYPYSLMACVAIAVSAVLGLAVSLSTFLVIGATSSLTCALHSTRQTLLCTSLMTCAGMCRQHSVGPESQPVHRPRDQRHVQPHVHIFLHPECRSRLRFVNYPDVCNLCHQHSAGPQSQSVHLAGHWRHTQPHVRSLLQLSILAAQVTACMWLR